MGYTHYFDHKRDFTNYEWDTLLKAFSILLEEKPKDIKIKGALGKGKPILNEKEIIFNGDHSLIINNSNDWGPEYGDHETMTITKLKDNPNNFGFCKTARKPYDIVVCTLLLLTKKIAPSCLYIKSDAKNISKSLGWKPAYKLAKIVMRKTILKVAYNFENDINIPQHWRQNVLDMARKSICDTDLFNYICDCYSSLEKSKITV